MKETGWVFTWSRTRRKWVPFLAHGFHSPFRWVPFGIEMFVSKWWNRVACSIYGGHDEILWRERLDPAPDGSFHCPMCCAVVGRDEGYSKKANRPLYYTTSGTMEANLYQTSDGTAPYRDRKPTT